jgi:uncharacterized protein (TIGR03382 family)
MSRALEDATAGAWIALASVVGAVLGILLPSLLTTTVEASGAITLALLGLALAALVRFGMRGVAVAAYTETAMPSIGDDAPLVLPGRATDPVHHPLRPRAPGLA